MPFFNGNTQRRVETECRLDDGNISVYTFCCDANLTESEVSAWIKNKKYLGIGVIHSVDGRIQNFTDRMKFWK